MSIEAPLACNPPRVAYISSPSLRKAADRLPSNPGRSSAVHALIESLELFEAIQRDSESTDDAQSSASPSQANRARLVKAVRASERDLKRYHDANYTDALLSAEVLAVPNSTKKRKREQSDDGSASEDEGHLEEDSHGLEHDCPAFAGLHEYCLEVAGGSLTAAKELKAGRADIAIHWDGGRHHATKDKAAGFCYVNDIVLAILELQRPVLAPKSRVPHSASSDCATEAPPPRRFKKIIYIDLDLHQGDGVAEAFENNPDVVTLSIHLWSSGFYPSTPKGHLKYSGPTGTALNLALPHSGLSDFSFLRLVENCIKPIYDAVQPDALVLQCGLDGLAGDPCKEFNLSLEGYGAAISRILSWRSEGTPVLMLGGGGYNLSNAARGWAYLTSSALGRPLDLGMQTIPEDCEIWEGLVHGAEQGESIDVPTNPGRRDENTEEDLEKIERVFAVYASKLAKEAVE